jgi:hypothetical protein
MKNRKSVGKRKTIHPYLERYGPLQPKIDENLKKK